MRSSLLLSLCASIGASFQTVAAVALDASRRGSEHGVDKRQAMPMPGQLRDFQVYEPVLVPEGPSNEYGCVYTKVLMEHQFKNSYGAPFVGNYTPPPCDFNRVVINLTVTSAGRQYDRLGLMYLGDTEVFRTSTAEPTANGIIFNYMKEMQMYNALWKQPQKIIFDEGNNQDSTYTGQYNTTLTATFFTVPDSPATADQVLPISSRSSGANSGSVFTVPGDNASVAYTLPRNVERAVVSLSACGQSNEEFWYSNVPSSEVETFPAGGALPGGGTFREVQLLIDGRLSGVSWPFPVIFTGGIVPGFWRPIVGIDAFDLRQHEIDITPWLGYLLDGKSHTFEIRVASVNDDGHGHVSLADEPTSFWLVSGSIFLFTGQGTTTATPPNVNNPPISLAFTSSLGKNANGTANETLTYATNATRSISVSSTLTLANGTKVPVSWSQKLSYTNFNFISDAGAVQLTKQTTQGVDVASGPSSYAFSHAYNYPLTVNSSYIYATDSPDLTLAGTFSRGKGLLTLGNPVFPDGLQNFDTSAKLNTPTVFSTEGASSSGSGSDNDTAQLPAGAASGYVAPNGRQLAGTVLNTTQVGSAAYMSTANTSSTYGTTEQWFTFGGVGDEAGDQTAELYTRHVKAVNTTIVLDQQTLLGRSYGGPSAPGSSPSQGSGALIAQGPGRGVRQFLGRGPGLAGPG